MPPELAASADALAQIVARPPVPPPLPASKPPPKPPPLHLDRAAVDRVVAEVVEVLSAELAPAAARESPGATAGLPSSADVSSSQSEVTAKVTTSVSAPAVDQNNVVAGSTNEVVAPGATVVLPTSAAVPKSQPAVTATITTSVSAPAVDQSTVAAASTNEAVAPSFGAGVTTAETAGHHLAIGASDTKMLDNWQSSIPPRTGYQPDSDKRWTVYYLAGWMALFSLFSMAPALPHGNLGAAPRWAQAVLLLSLLQLAYVAWVASIPDWATLWSSMIVFTSIAALYGAMMTIALSTPLEQPLPLDMSDVRRETPLWCAGMMLLSFLLAYLCGRAAWRWRRTFELLHA
jgi:hypothetical protein